MADGEVYSGLVATGDAEVDVSALGKYGCIVCNKGFRDIRNLRRHVSLVHEERSSPVTCPRTWCSAEFTVLAEMIRHKKLPLIVSLPQLPEGFQIRECFSCSQEGSFGHGKENERLNGT